MLVRTNQTGATAGVVDFRLSAADAELSTKRIETETNRPTVFTVCEVARILRLGKISVYHGEIPCIRIGRRILIPRHALERLLDNLRPISKPAA